MTTFQAAQIRLPRGELAILLAIPASLRGEARMKAAISGIEDAGYAAALVDAEGAVAAATSGFDQLGLGRTALWTLVQDVSREHDRLVKKLVTVEGGTLPVGFARLTDEPALHLLLTSNEVDADEEDEPAAAPPEAELPAVSAQVAAEAEPEEIVMAKVASAVDEADAAPAPAPVPQAPDEPRVLPTQPIRFVWRTDASGRFAQVSSEFIDAVGGNAADVIGRSFRDVATVFGFDLNDEIAALARPARHLVGTHRAVADRRPRAEGAGGPRRPARLRSRSHVRRVSRLRRRAHGRRRRGPGRTRSCPDEPEAAAARRP